MSPLLQALIGLVTILGGVAVVAQIFVGGQKWKPVAEAASLRADQEQARADVLDAERMEMHRTIGKLEERPDFSQMVAMLKAQREEMHEVLLEQERGASERTARAVEAVLLRIDDRFVAAEERNDRRHRETAELIGHVAERLNGNHK